MLFIICDIRAVGLDQAVQIAVDRVHHLRRPIPVDVVQPVLLAVFPPERIAQLPAEDGICSSSEA